MINTDCVVNKQVWWHVEDQVLSNMRDLVWEQVEDQVYDQVRYQVCIQVCIQVRHQVWNQVFYD
jgi:hypothetical protein